MTKLKFFLYLFTFMFAETSKSDPGFIFGRYYLFSSVPHDFKVMVKFQQLVLNRGEFIAKEKESNKVFLALLVEKLPLRMSRRFDLPCNYRHVS